ADIDNILSMYNNTQVAPLITELLMVPRGQKLKDSFKESIENEAEMFCIIETIPNAPGVSENYGLQFVGMTALWHNRERGQRHCSFSIVLMPQFWNKGYGTEITKFMVDHAFFQLNMHRLSLEVYEGNDRAVALYEKQGFVVEGRQRKALWRNGKWRDVILMGILFEEW
ncbi:acyl-CoA N-acyltransferase, partial [Agrocybe pediades]